MKKFYAAAMALTVALSAMAASPRLSRTAAARQVPSSQSSNLRTSSDIVLQKEVNRFFQTQAEAKKFAKAQELARKQRTVIKSLELEEVPQPIFEPEGRSQNYLNASTGYSYSIFGLSYAESEGLSNIVYGEDGDVYIRDIISSLPTGCYVKGTLSDGKITVILPQIAYYSEYEGEIASYSASKCELATVTEDGEEYQTYVNAEDQTIEYILNEDGSITLNLNDGDPTDTDTTPQYIIGLVEDTTAGASDWFGYGDAYQNLTEFNLEATAVPDGLELEDWTWREAQYAGRCKVGLTDEAAYIVGMFEEMPEGVIRIDIDGDKGSLNQQFMGDYYGYIIYALGCKWADDNYTSYELLESMPMTVDRANKVISTNEPLIDLLINLGNSDYNPWTYFENPDIFYQTEEMTNANPQDPEIIDFVPYAMQSWGAEEGLVEWDIPYLNVNRCLLDADKMYYNIYFNDAIYTFTQEKYPDCDFSDGDITDVPYYWGDDWDISLLGSSHLITFKEGDSWKFGCQSFYPGSDGVLYKSNLVEFIPSGVQNVTTDSKDIQSVEFFNLQGQRVVNPGAGLYIMRQHFTDGSIRSIKIAHK